MTNTYFCEYSIKTPDDAQQICLKHVEFFTKIEKLVHLDGFYYKNISRCTVLWMSKYNRPFFGWPYNINWLVFITEMKCLLRGTNWVFK
jgi:hypothetical protein